MCGLGLWCVVVWGEGGWCGVVIVVWGIVYWFFE